MTDLKQLEQLYNHSYLSYIATYLGAIFVFWLFKNIAEPGTLNTWFIVFSVLTAIRFVVSWFFQKKELTGNLDKWLISFLALSMISGTMWGLTGFLLIPDDTLTQLDSILYHGMLLLIIAVLVAGSLITYSVSKMVYLSFSVPAVVPQCFMLISMGDEYHSFLGGFMLAYVCTVFIISIYINRMFQECNDIRTQNEYYKEILDKNGIKTEI